MDIGGRRRLFHSESQQGNEKTNLLPASLQQGYALIEYESLDEATESIRKLNGARLYDQVINVDFAFVRPDDELKIKSGEHKIRDRALGTDRGRDRSRSPDRVRSRSRSTSLDYSRQH